jgi:GT2 family glycosyltransferase
VRGRRWPGQPVRPPEVEGARTTAPVRETPGVVAAVLNYNGRAHLEAILPTLLGQDYPALEVVVVDNASTDDSVEWSRGAFPQVRILPQARNRGYSVLNAAFDEAAGSGAEFVLLLTNDLMLDARCVSHAVEAALRDPRIGIVGFTMLGALRWVEPSALAEASARWEGLEVEESGWIEGAAMLVRREIVELLGGIDPVYFAYADEDDFQHRVRAAGYRLVRINTPVWHNAGRNVLAGASAFGAYLQMRNLIRHHAKNQGLWRGVKTAAWVAVNACRPRDTSDREMPFEVRLRPFGPLTNSVIVARALAWNLLHLPQTMGARWRTQRRIRRARARLGTEAAGR